MSLLPPYSVVPSAPPSNVLVIREDSRSVTLSWNAPPAADHNGELTGYTIKVKNHNGDEARPPLTTDNTCTSKEVDGLKPNTDYIFEVSAMTEAGSGPPKSINKRTAEEGKIAYFIISGTQNTNIFACCCGQTALACVL